MRGWKQLTVFAAMILIVGCKGDIIEPESVDADYNVTYYAKPPHSNETQGYLYLKANGDSQYMKLEPISSSPFTLTISVTDKKGMEALDFIRSKEDSPIISIQDVNLAQPGTASCYKVVTSKYFQSRNFFVSESYRAADSKTSAYDVSVMPYITVRMKAGQDISSVEEEYKGTITLIQENEDGTFLFSSRFKTSYEVLMLAIHIFEKPEVAWAEALMSGTLSVRNQ